MSKSRKYVPKLQCPATDVHDGKELRCRNLYPEDRDGHRGLHSSFEHVWGELTEADQLRREAAKRRKQDWWANYEARQDEERITGRRRLAPGERNAGASLPLEPSPLQRRASKIKTSADALDFVSEQMEALYSSRADSREEDGWFYGASEMMGVLSEARELIGALR